MCKGPYLTILALLAFLTVAGAAASLEARFYPDHLQVEEGSSGNAMLVVSGSDVETDLTLSFHGDGVTIDAPGRIHVVPGRTTSTEIMFGAGGKGTFPVTVRVGSPSASAEATILVTTSTEGGITVVARERDYDGDGYREGVEIYVHRSDDEDVAIP
ncbi:MAG TPA: hypothetical protein EYP43_02670, partial [Thermoplasmata archaeon]|nr:hypothetical protein [Thermoplasmata archaeon]